MKWKPDSDEITFIYDDKEPNIFKRFYILEKGFNELNSILQDMVLHNNFVGNDEGDYTVTAEPLRFFKEFIPRVMGFKPILGQANSLLELEPTQTVAEAARTIARQRH
jgi:hypothetical protein